MTRHKSYNKEEFKKKLSDKAKLRYANGFVHPRGMLGKSNSWGKHSIQTKEKMSKNHADFSGIKHPLYGKHHSEETKQKMREAKKRCIINGWKPHNTGKEFLSMEKNPNWQGGKSFEPYSVDWTKTLKRSIRERDKFICKICNEQGIYVHHIDYNKKNCNPNNLVTLCNSCHSKTNYNREKWIKFFKETTI